MSRGCTVDVLGADDGQRAPVERGNPLADAAQQFFDLGRLLRTRNRRGG